MTIQTYTPQETQKLSDTGDAIIIDVREIEEHKSEHIPNAINLPLSTLTAEQLKPYEGKKLIFHCGGGSRAKKACDLINNKIPNEKISILEGGFRGWKTNNLPTVL